MNLSSETSRTLHGGGEGEKRFRWAQLAQLSCGLRGTGPSARPRRVISFFAEAEPHISRCQKLEGIPRKFPSPKLSRWIYHGHSGATLCKNLFLSPSSSSFAFFSSFRFSFNFCFAYIRNDTIAEDFYRGFVAQGILLLGMFCADAARKRPRGNLKERYFYPGCTRLSRFLGDTICFFFPLHFSTVEIWIYKDVLCLECYAWVSFVVASRVENLYFIFS